MVETAFLTKARYAASNAFAGYGSMPTSRWTDPRPNSGRLRTSDLKSGASPISGRDVSGGGAACRGRSANLGPNG
jgi:hypothetical protein